MANASAVDSATTRRLPVACHAASLFRAVVIAHIPAVMHGCPVSRRTGSCRADWVFCSPAMLGGAAGRPDSQAAALLS